MFYMINASMTDLLIIDFTRGFETGLDSSFYRTVKKERENRIAQLSSGTNTLLASKDTAGV
jgi:hypothetical protein